MLSSLCVQYYVHRIVQLICQERRISKSYYYLQISNQICFFFIFLL